MLPMHVKETLYCKSFCSTKTDIYGAPYMPLYRVAEVIVMIEVVKPC